MVIKTAVDIRRGVLAGGGNKHSDCEEVLLDDGSQQQDIWGASWEPDTSKITFESLINLRPRQNNYRMLIEDMSIRKKITEIIGQLLEEA